MLLTFLLTNETKTCIMTWKLVSLGFRYSSCLLLSNGLICIPKTSNIYIRKYEKGKLWTPHVPLLVHLKVHSPRYRLNPNYAIVLKHDIDKLLVAGFIQLMEETTWLSPIVVILKKNGKRKIYVDFKKLNATIKKDPFPLPFTNEVLNIMVGCEAYSFLDGYYRYHQISIAP